MADDNTAIDALELATELTVAWLSNTNTRASAEEVPAFLERMHSALTALASPAASTEEPESLPEYTPAVTVRRSLASKDHIISMIDGKPYKSLKRHLSKHGLTPTQYRERYGLKADYPMVAENYAELRRSLAKKIGLGRKPKDAEAEAQPRKASTGAKRKPATRAKAAAPASAPAPNADAGS